MRQGDPFFDGDQVYLRQVQYRDGSRLTARASLHAKYGTAPIAWFPWLTAQIDWPRRARVLEVGCGPGWLWSEAAAHLPNDLDLTLTDLSEGMVRDALGRVAGRGHRRVTGGVVDAQALPLSNAGFDLAVANHMLYHVPDPTAAVTELARVLHEGGCLVAATNGVGHLRELFEVRDEVFGEPGVVLSDVFGIGVAEPILRATFAEVTWRPYDDRLVCHDPDDVMAFLTSFPPADDASAPELKRLADAVQARFGRGDGVMEISKETGVFLCKQPKK